MSTEAQMRCRALGCVRDETTGMVGLGYCARADCPHKERQARVMAEGQSPYDLGEAIRRNAEKERAIRDAPAPTPEQQLANVLDSAYRWVMVSTRRNDSIHTQIEIRVMHARLLQAHAMMQVAKGIEAIAPLLADLAHEAKRANDYAADPL